MDRPALKKDAKSILNSHFSFYFLLWLPIFILEAVGGIMYVPDMERSDPFTMTVNIGLFLTLLASIMTIGVFFISIDAIRQTLTYENPLQKSFIIFSRGEYFLGTILLYILISIFTFLWTLLLVIPGIIKAFSYSQAYYIYRDAIDHGEQIGYLDAITRSRQLMDGHKWEYFVMILSFIGWGLVVLITFGIAAIWVQPYYTLSFANFYNELADQQTVHPATSVIDAPQQSIDSSDSSSSDDASDDSKQ